MFLERCRVLDLTDENGLLCGRILADLGADVIKVERPLVGVSTLDGLPGVCPSRQELFRYAFNLNKRSVTLDINSARGRKLLRRLLQTADMVIESRTGRRSTGSLPDHLALRRLNPRIIVVSITPFGEEGPYSDFEGPDLVLMAMGGLMYLTGDEDRPPVRIGFPQAWLHASGNAAVAGLVALCYRDNTGRGQLVDVSAQASLTPCLMNSIPFFELNGTNLKRSGSRRSGTTAAGTQKQTWPCKDGFLTYAMMSGRSGAVANRALAEWIDAEGHSTEAFRKINWDSFDAATAPVEQIDLATGVFGDFFMAKTRRELYEGAVERRVMVYPVYSPRELLDDEQLRDREFLVKLGRPEATYPGAFVKMSNGSIEMHHTPDPGEHNEDVYVREMGIAGQELARLKEAGVV